MSITTQTIQYQFAPDANTLAICEQLASDLRGNGVSLADISAQSALSANLTITSAYTWTIEVSLKSKVVAGRASGAVLHENLTEAQLAAKKQGQEILQKSLGKIELIKNIQEDPAHYFITSNVKLSGGPLHAVNLPCSNHCNQGQVICPRCQGKGTLKATTKKEDFLGTSDNLSLKHNCPQCKGKGSINCQTCSGHGEISHRYEIKVTASSKYQHMAGTQDSKAKKAIEHFLSHKTNKELLRHYLTPVVSQLDDIDAANFRVTYQSNTQYIFLRMMVLNETYPVIAFGNKLNCIQKPPILDHTLVPAIKKIIGRNTRRRSAAKLHKLHSFPLLSQLLAPENNNRSGAELEALLSMKSNSLLSQVSVKWIIEQLASLRLTSVPYYSTWSWSLLVIPGMLTGFYFGLLQQNLTATLNTVAALSLTILTAGYLSSKNLTAWKRKKQALKENSARHEIIPAVVAALLISASVIAPKSLSPQQRWTVFLSTQQYYRLLSPLTVTTNETISNPALIKIGQQYLQILGYPKINPDGNFDAATAAAVKDFQAGFGIYDAHYLDNRTMRLLAYYAAAKASFEK